MSKANQILLMIFIFIIFVLIIIYPGLSQYPATTGWGAGIDYGRQYIIDHGHIPPITHDGTWQGRLTNYGSQDVASKIEFSIINIVTGTVASEEGVRFLNIFIFSKILLMPLCGVFIYCWVAKGRSRNLRDMALIGLFAMMPLATVLPTSPDSGVAGNMITMALIMPILAMMISDGGSRKRVILFLLIIVFLLFWHTWSLYFLILSITLLIGSFLKKNAQLRSITFYCIIAYLFVGAYLNYDQMIGAPGSSLLSILSLENTQLVLAFNSNVMSYRTGGSAYSVIQIIASTLIIGIIAYANLRIFLNKSKAQHSVVEQSIVWLSIGLVVCWLSLFLLGGATTLLARVLEPSIPVSIICAGYLLAETRKRNGQIQPSICLGKEKRGTIRPWLRISLLPMILVTLMIFSATSHLFTPVTPTEFYGEEISSYGFAGTYSEKDMNYFSDFRLGTRLIMHDFYNIYTIDKNSQEEELYGDLLKIYYNWTSPQDSLSELIGNDDHCVITTRYQSIVGITDPNQNLIPAMSGFENNFRLSDAYLNIYTNGDVCIWGHWG